MAVRGTVRLWDADEGWGVVDSPETPGGCWAGFSAVAVAGYAALDAGDQVMLEWEAARQDGWAFRATRLWRHGTEPVERTRSAGGGAYRSTLTLTFDPPDDPD
ncbi:MULTISPECIES: cold-shock protein [Actinoplanes]|uniref:cold-shock protein n=1 Tax=Actinoplanes TaxID=1865 RepID=UPI0005F2A3E6|nr:MULTISPECIES: cold-shock protein [Actinoplanes]GLY04065.1 hypothetical protein Acsp01_44440 [Actinoplanes sp. NBRC 101535]